MRRRLIHTALVGSFTLFREGLAQILEEVGFRIIASQPTIADLLRQSIKPVVLIIDAGNDPRGAARDVALFKGHQPTARVAVIADCVEFDAALSVFRAGANAYFFNEATADTLVKLLDLVMQGQTNVATNVPLASRQVENIQIPQQRICLNRGSDETALLLDSNASLRQELSVREKSILQCLALGDSNKAIARKVDIAEATVKAHVKTILRKIRAQNRTQAAIWAMNNASQVRMTE
jgi:two-component system nitrate/nitrite response regulator NarL